MVDVYWEYTPSGTRYLHAGDWSLDPDRGHDTIESLERDIEELTAAVKFMRKERQERRERGARDQIAGREYATRPKRLAYHHVAWPKPRSLVFGFDPSGEGWNLRAQTPNEHLSDLLRLGRKAHTPWYPSDSQQKDAVPGAPLQSFDKRDYERRAGWAHATGGKQYGA